MNSENPSSSTSDSTSDIPIKPVKILKAKGNFMNTDKSTLKSLTFADQHGEALTENNFVKELHYSEFASQVQTISHRGCCSIS